MDHILLSELNYTELEKLYKSNKWLQNQLYEYACERCNEELQEIMHYFDDVKSLRYEVGNIYNNYIRLHSEYYKEFLQACKELDKDFCVFPEEFSVLLDRLISKADFLYDCESGFEEISDSRWDHFNKWFSDGIETTINYILSYCDGITNIDESEYIEEWAMNCGEQYATDYTFIYELEVRKYA